MTPVILYRIDDARRMRRYYRMDVQLSIFLFRENLQESDGQMPLFSCIVRTVERKTRETLGFWQTSAARGSR
jgi:hypothetical protein